MPANPFGSLLARLLRFLRQWGDRPSNELPGTPPDTPPPVVDPPPTDPPVEPLRPPIWPWPGESWQTSETGEGVDLERVRRATPIQGHGVMIRNGRVVHTWGDSFGQLQNWASSVRPLLPLLWGVWARLEGFSGLDWLETPVCELPSRYAQEQFQHRPDVRVKHLISYTSRGSWHYSSGSDWIHQHRILEELFMRFQGDARSSVADLIQQYIFAEIAPADSTLEAFMTDAGETARFNGSVRDVARMSGLVLNRGEAVNRVVAADYIDRMIAGGPDGNATGETPDDPNGYKREGYAIHLVRDGRAWEEDERGNLAEMKLPDVPDHTFMFRDGGGSQGAAIGVPALALVIAYRGRYTPELFLPEFCRSCAA